MRKSELQALQATPARLAGARAVESGKRLLRLGVHHAMPLLMVTAIVTALSVQASSQSLVFVANPSTTEGVTARGELNPAYVRPAQHTKWSNYVFDAFGPYPIAGAALTAGIDQWSNAPPEWNSGVAGYSKRFGSEFAIAAIGSTTRYGLAEAFKEDTLYYRCECRGPFPRLRHAVISTLTGRRGENGHRIFSFSALVSPYAGSMVAVYLWYPDRFDAKDAFRMGNYNMLKYMGGNIALEFFYTGPHSLLRRIHLNDAHGSPLQGPNR
jgi:hypothetical protein